MAGDDVCCAPAPPNIELEQTLFRLAALLRQCNDPWSIFGGAALYLHGYMNEPIADVDVLVSVADARRIAVDANLPNEAGGDAKLFRSKLLLHPPLGALDVEIMGGFQIFSDGRWQDATVTKPVELRYGAAIISVASLEDIESILRLSGREKDLKRLYVMDSHKEVIS